jgi:hypothetical protein
VDAKYETTKADRLFSNRPEVGKLWSNDNQPHPELVTGF